MFTHRHAKCGKEPNELYKKVFINVVFLLLKFLIISPDRLRASNKLLLTHNKHPCQLPLIASLMATHQLIQKPGKCPTGRCLACWHSVQIFRNPYWVRDPFLLHRIVSTESNKVAFS